MSVFLHESKENVLTLHRNLNNPAHVKIKPAKKEETIQSLFYTTTRSIEAPRMREEEFLDVGRKLDLIAKKIQDLPLSKTSRTLARRLNGLLRKYEVKKYTKDSFEITLWEARRELSKLLTYKEYIFRYRDGITPRRRIIQLRYSIGGIESSIRSLEPVTVEQEVMLAKVSYVIPSLKSAWPTSLESFAMKMEAFFCCRC